MLFRTGMKKREDPLTDCFFRPTESKRENNFHAREWRRRKRGLEVRETQTVSEPRRTFHGRRVSLKEIAGKDPDVGQPGETSPDGRGVIRAYHLSRPRQSFRTSQEDPFFKPMEMRIAAISKRRIESIASFLYNRHKSDSIAFCTSSPLRIYFYKKSKVSNSH